MEDKVISPEKAEEAKLKARYPHLGAKPGGSDFLRKRLQKGVRFLRKHYYKKICSYESHFPSSFVAFIYISNINDIQIW